jgi:hypothetical protein
MKRPHRRHVPRNQPGRLGTGRTSHNVASRWLAQRGDVATTLGRPTSNEPTADVVGVAGAATIVTATAPAPLVSAVAEGVAAVATAAQ